MWIDIALVVSTLIVLIVILRLVYLRGVRRGALIVNNLIKEAMNESEESEDERI